MITLDGRQLKKNSSSGNRMVNSYSCKKSIIVRLICNNKSASAGKIDWLAPYSSCHDHHRSTLIHLPVLIPVKSNQEGTLKKML